jgi:hypothetical protein
VNFKLKWKIRSVYVKKILNRLFTLHSPKYISKSRGSPVGIALAYGLDDLGSRVRFLAGLGIFLFTTASRMALGLTQPPIQWVPGAFSMGVNRPGREVDHSSLSSTEVKE